MSGKDESGGSLRRAEARTLLALASALRPCPPRLRVRVGHGIGLVAWGLLRRRRKLAAENVASTLLLGEAEARRVARRSFMHFGRVLAECLSLPAYSREPALSRLDVHGFDRFLEAHRLGRGVIVFSAHYGNWELIALRQAIAGYPMDFIARPLDNPVLERSFAEWRSLAGNRVLGKRGALRRAVACLRDGRSLAILIDQNVRDRPRLFMPFLGRLASVTPSLGQLAARLESPVVPVVSRPREDGGYLIEYLPAIESDAPDREERALELTRAANALIESWIRQAPENWLWLHDRWKSTPLADEEPIP